MIDTANIPVSYTQIKNNQITFYGFWYPLLSLSVQRLDVTTGNWQTISPVNMSSNGSWQAPVSFQSSHDGAYTIRFIDSEGNDSSVFNVETLSGTIKTYEPQPFTGNILGIQNMDQPEPTQRALTLEQQAAVQGAEFEVWRLGQGKPVFNADKYPYVSNIQPQTKQMPLVGNDGKPLKLEPDSVVV